jgi:hypothetical protein
MLLRPAPKISRVTCAGFSTVFLALTRAAQIAQCFGRQGVRDDQGVSRVIWCGTNPGYYEPLRLPSRPGLPRGSPVEFFFPCRAGSHVFLRVSSAHMPSALLRRTPGVLFSLFTSCFPGLGLFFPHDASLSQSQLGRRPHCLFEALPVGLLCLPLETRGFSRRTEICGPEQMPILSAFAKGDC